MRLASFSFMLFSAAVLALGCSSNTDDGGTGGSGGSTTGSYSPKTNGVAMSEADACKAIKDGQDAAQSALASRGVICTLAVVSCPDYLRNAVPASAGTDECLQWDQGTIQGCVAFYKTFNSCEEFQNRPCIVGYIPNSSPKGCPATTDAGPETSVDAPVAETSTEDVQKDDVQQDDVQQDDVQQDDVQQDDVQQDDVVLPEDAGLQIDATAD